MSSNQVEFKITAESSKDIIGIVGNVCELGCWKLDEAVLMKKKSEVEFSHKINLPKDTVVKYRYFTGRTFAGKILVDSWEGSLDTRSFVVSAESTQVKEDGVYNAEKSSYPTTAGWLSHQSEMRIYISSSEQQPFLKPFNCQFGCNKLLINVTSEPSISSKLLEVDWSNSHQNKFISDATKPVEIPVDSSRLLTYVFEYIENEGSEVITALRFYNEDLTYAGIAYISSSMLENSRGFLKVVLTGPTCPVALLNVGYSVIHPFKKAEMLMKTSMNIWKRETMLLVGHRGCGNSFTSHKLSNVRENSLMSFNMVSNKPGAFIEFDVQLSKDKVPVVYHDLTVCLETCSVSGKGILTEVPVCGLYASSLKVLKTRHRSRKHSTLKLDFDENDYEVNPPFPTLVEVFDEVPVQTGFNIELKYPCIDINGHHEDHLRDYIDANQYLDLILEVVFSKSEDREIIFSSFNVDICIMVRRKQNRYPVLLLTNGDTNFYTPTQDLRARSNKMALATSIAEDFLGIDSLEQDVYVNSNIVKEVHNCGKIIAFYGDNVADNLEKFEELGVDIAIYDRIHTNEYKPTKRRTNSSQEAIFEDADS